MTITNRVSLKSVEFGITSIQDVVDAPGTPTATAGVESASVAFTPAVTGGTATSFTAISTPGSITGSAAASPITVSGLTAGTAYTFKVYGTNASGVWSGVQSNASNSVTPTTGAFQSIATATGTGSSGVITFSSIPGTYQHLQLRAIIKGTDTTTVDGLTVNLQFNSDTGANYARHAVYGFGGTPAIFSNKDQVSIPLARIGLRSDATQANMVGVGVIDIHDYASTTKNTTVRALYGAEANVTNSTLGVYLLSGFWNNTAAVTSITLTSTVGNFTTSTQFALYGIKGA